jgi:hypothetical protein
MNLSSLTTQDKIKLAAELDGAEIKYCETLGGLWAYSPCADKWYPSVDKIQYSTSYDAIIPLIQKRISSLCWHSFQDALGLICAETFLQSEGENYTYEGDGSYREAWLIFQATPSQLLDVLLVVTGKAEL